MDESEDLARALVELKLTRVAVEERDEEIQDLAQQVVRLQNENENYKRKLSTIAWQPALTLLDLPCKVVRLQEKLQEEPDQILEVQDQWERFVLWRYDLLRQIADTSETFATETFESSPIEIVAHQFSTIDQLGINLCDKLWEMVLNCINPSKVPMSVLTDCLEIIVRTDDKTDTEHDRVIKSAMYQIHCTREDGLIEFESLKRRCEDTLARAIAQHTQAAIQAITCRSRRQSEYVDADGQLLKSLYVVNDLLVSSFPMGYMIEEFFMDSIRSELTKQLKELSESAASMDIYSTFRIVNWIGVSQRDAGALGMDGVVSCFDEADDLFTNAYLVVIQKQVRDASEQLVRHTYTPKVTENEGYLYTDVVEELVGYVFQQIKFLQQYLAGKRLREAVHLCVTIFQARQQYQHDDLISINNSNLDNLPIGYLEHVCAVVNDNYRIQNDMMELFVACEAKLEPTDRDLLQNFMHEVACGFDSVVEEAIRAITLIIFRDLDSSLLVLFTDRWLLGTVKPLLAMLSTFDDYLVDIEKWVKQSFHVRDLRESCIGFLVGHYVERLNDSDVEFQKEDMSRIAERMAQDVDAIQEYCRKHQDAQQPESNSADRARNRTAILDLVASFFSSSDPSTLFAELAKELGKSVGPVMERLLTYRVDLSERQQEQLSFDLKEWELWAEHNALSPCRFHVERSIAPVASSSTKKRVQKAQALLGKGIEKAKAKRSSIVRGVQGVSTAFRRKSGDQQRSDT